MPIKKGPHLDNQDVYIDYEFEDVMFRRLHENGLIFRKFYGEKENPLPIPANNRLFNDALRYGEEITKDEYTNK